MTYGTGDVAGAYTLGNGITGTSKLVIDDDAARHRRCDIHRSRRAGTAALRNDRDRRRGARRHAVARRPVLPDDQRGVAAPAGDLRTLTSRPPGERMPDVSFVNLFVVCLVAAARRWLIGFAPRLRLPSVVLEIVIGIVLGPSVLGWVKVDLPVQILALIGLAFLLFLSGLEIDPRRLHGRLLRVRAARLS